MTTIDKVIELLKCYTINNCREQLVEAHSLIEKYLGISGSGGSVREANRITKCVDCGREFTRLSMKKIRCDECREKRKLNWRRDYYKRSK
jgi:DNA-directed RNA polymerase subunit RPC12/RpoP